MPESKDRDPLCSGMATTYGESVITGRNRICTN